MKIPLMDAAREYETLKTEILPAVEKVLSSGNYILGEQVERFEQAFADFVKCKYAIAVANGTDALVIALRAAGIGVLDEVITTPYTFFATAEAIAAVGATPVFADVCEDTYAIDPKKIEAKITGHTKAILPVHLFGHPADMEKIMAIAKKHRLMVIEDACQGIGASFQKQHVGTIGQMGCFSFFPTKNLGCAGDGGMIVTNDEQLNILCRAYRAHGGGEMGQRAWTLQREEEQEILPDEIDATTNRRKYYNYLIGYNSRLDAIQAAILQVKLKHLAKSLQARSATARFYNDALQEIEGLKTPETATGAVHGFHMYPLRSDDRDRIAAALSAHGVATGIYYPVPLHLQRAFDNLGYKAGDFPVAERLARQTFAIPVFPELRADERSYVVEKLREVMKGSGTK